MQKLIYNIRYWFFIGINWNFTLAFFSIYYEIKGERKYHLNTIKLDRLQTLSVKGDNKEHASIYQACNYYILEKGFDYIRSIHENKSLVDFGCGKGRAIVVAAHYGFESLTGIDFAPALCNIAEKNIEEVKQKYPLANFNIICDDVVNYEIKENENLFFFFNPFDHVIMLKVVKNILASFRKKERKIYVMYANPVHKEILLSANFKEVYYLKKLQYLELSILMKDIDYDDI